MSKYLIRVLLSCALLHVGPADAEHQASVKNYPWEPAVVRLSGKLVMEDHFGPPNFGEDPAEDLQMSICVLLLEYPINIGVGYPPHEITDSVEGVSKVRPIFLSRDSGANYQRLRGLVGEWVTFEGSLAPKHTGWHVYTLLIVESFIAEVECTAHGSEGTACAVE